MVDDPPFHSPIAPPCLYANIIVPRHIARSFTYIVPEHLRPVLRIGHCVVVPFGLARLQGAVISLADTLPPGLNRDRLKEVGAIVADDASREIPSGLFDLAKQISEYYVAPWGQCLRLVMPPSRANRVRGCRFTLTEQGRAALTAGLESEEVRSVLKRISMKPGGIKRTTLVHLKGSNQEALLESLVLKRWIVEEFQRSATSIDVKPSPLVTPDGSEVREEGVSLPFVSGGMVSESGEELSLVLRRGQPARIFLQAPLVDRIPLLLRGITQTLADGRSVLVIVGEAERARWLVETLAKEGTTVPACLHSGLSENERTAVWMRAKEPGPHVVVGTRSAVFLPFRSLGMIWIEGNEEPSLKEPQEPRYHAQEVAWLRAQVERAVLVLGSPHPSLEAAIKSNAPGTVLRQETPVARRPKVDVVDLRPLGKGILLSPSLVEAIHEAIDRQAGVLLFLNRKGYAGALICGDCGQVPRCNGCRVALSCSRRSGRLSCPYCGFKTTIPRICASCAGHRLRSIGVGTERVEEEVSRLFPAAKIIRADSDAARKPSQAAALWKAIKDREWSILIGTQMVLRDYAVPPVGLVGVVQADAGLSLPDFRAAERTYHMLCDAAALARPSRDGGRMIMQSYLPSHHAIQAVLRHDEAIFTSEELSHRVSLGYPPAVHLVSLQVSGTSVELVQEASMAWVGRLQAFRNGSAAGRAPAGSTDVVVRPEAFAVLGPVPLAIPKVRGRYRWQILIKSRERARGIQAVRESIEQIERTYPLRAVKFTVDVDPVEMW